MKNEEICYCGINTPYKQCCGKYIENNEIPETPEALMRSRFSAYVLHNVDYIGATMRDKAAINYDPQETLSRIKAIQWQDLKVINTKIKTPTLGFVTYEARYLHEGNLKMLREKSEFHKIEGKWYYVDGKLLNPHG